MKKNLLNFLCLGAIALVSSVGFSACSENDLNEPSTNPTGEVANSDVKVNFVMNVEYGQSATTRMSANTVQWPSSTENTFRGIDNAILLPYISSGATFLTENAATGTNKIKAARKFDLAKLYTTEADNTQNGETNANQTTSSRRIIELPMPLHSNLMLIYGKAIKGESTTMDMDAVEGKIDMNISDDAFDTKIKLVSRLDNNEVSLYQKAERLTAFILNRIMQSQVGVRTNTLYKFEENHPYSGFHRSEGEYIWEYMDGAAPGALSWAQLGALYTAWHDDDGAVGSSGMTALEEALGAAYYKIVTVGAAELNTTTNKVNPGEYRAGSAEAVARMLYDLYILCEKTYNVIPTSNAEADAMRLAARIGHQINGFYSIQRTAGKATIRNIGSSSEGSSIRGFITTQLTQTEDNANPITGVTDNDFVSGGKFAGLTDDIMLTFPSCFGLPAGAAQLAYEVPSSTSLPTNVDEEIIKENGTAIKQFVYHYTNQPFVTDMPTTTPSFDPQKYMYPAELAYFVNSPLRVSDTGINGDNVNTLFPNGTNNWDTDNWSGWTTGAVTSTTKSIAVLKNINYGVAMLKTTVSAGNEISLFDNRQAITGDASDAEVPVSGLRMTGILIGGQDNTVDWQYLPVNPNEATYVIYDNAVGSYDSTAKRYNGIELNGNAANYTIVFDNYTPGVNEDQKTVRFALEFRNGSDDFWGKDNLVRAGGTFYLMGELSLNSAEGEPSWDTYYQVPPLIQTGDDAGKSSRVTRVFIQDHVTVANITLGKKALQQAVVSVPDLRTSSMSLGLSVDLSWTQGLTFNPVIGGN